MGVDAVVTGKISQDEAGNYVISYQLIDIVRGQLTQGRQKGFRMGNWC